jgi:hypothetical protein
MDCSATVFVDEFLNFFNIYCHLPVLGCPETLSSSTDTQLAMERECHSKTTVRLEECSTEASWSISRVSVAGLLSFTQNLMQTRCSILPSIAEKMKHEVKKASSSVFTAWCHVADWCNRLAEVWPWPPLSSSFTEAVTTITVWELIAVIL